MRKDLDEINKRRLDLIKQAFSPEGITPEEQQELDELRALVVKELRTTLHKEPAHD